MKSFTKEQLDSIDLDEIEEQHKRAWDYTPGYRESFGENQDLYDPYRMEEEQKQAQLKQTGINPRSDFISGVKRGIDQTQGMFYGAAGLAGSAIGADSLKDWGMEGYRRNMAESEENPAKYSFKDVYTGKAGVGGAIDWAQGTLGELVPTMASAAMGSGFATLAGKTVLKKAIGSAVKHGLEKGLKDKAGRLLTEKAIKNEILKKVSKSGMYATVGAMESGGMYGEVLDEYGVDAPMTALAFGALAASLEGMGGNSRLIDGFIDGFAKGKFKTIKGIAGEILKNTSEEALQEAGQEALAVLNTVVNTDEKLLTKKNFERIVESAAAGAVGGFAGGAAHGVLSSGKEETEDRPPVPDESTEEGELPPVPDESREERGLPPEPSDAEKILLNPEEVGKSPADLLTEDEPLLVGDDESKAASEFTDEELAAFDDAETNFDTVREQLSEMSDDELQVTVNKAMEDAESKQEDPDFQTYQELVLQEQQRRKEISLGDVIEAPEQVEQADPTKDTQGGPVVPKAKEEIPQEEGLSGETKEEIPQGTPIKYKTKKGEGSGVYLGRHPKNPNLIQIEKEDGKKSFISEKSLIRETEQQKSQPETEKTPPSRNISDETVSQDLESQLKGQTAVEKGMAEAKAALPQQTTGEKSAEELKAEYEKKSQAEDKPKTSQGAENSALLQMVNDQISTLKAQKKTVPEHLIKKRAELVSGETFKKGEAGGDVVFGHPQATNIMPEKYGNLIPIKVNSREEVLKHIDKAQKQVDVLQQKLGNKKINLEEETVLDLLRTETMPELNRLLKSYPETDRNPTSSPKSTLSLPNERMQNHIDKRIEKLETIEAVDKEYSGDSKVDVYARAKAREVYQQGSEPSNDQITLTGNHDENILNEDLSGILEAINDGQKVADAIKILPDDRRTNVLNAIVSKARERGYVGDDNVLSDKSMRKALKWLNVDRAFKRLNKAVDSKKQTIPKRVLEDTDTEYTVTKAKGDPNAKQIRLKSGSEITYWENNRDFPGEKDKSDRAEIWFVESKKPGEGSQLMKAAINEVKAAGAKTVTISPQTAAGKKLTNKLIDTGYLNKPLKTSETGKMEFSFDQTNVSATDIETQPTERPKTVTESKKIAEGHTVSFPGKGGVEVTGKVTKLNDKNAWVTTKDGKVFRPSIGKIKVISSEEKQPSSKAEDVAKDMTDKGLSTEASNAYIQQAAYKRAGGEWARRVNISDLRKDFPNLSKEEFDTKIKDMQSNGELQIYPLDNPREITSEIEDGGIQFGGQTGHVVYVAEPKVQGSKNWGKLTLEGRRQLVSAAGYTGRKSVSLYKTTWDNMSTEDQQRLISVMQEEKKNSENGIKETAAETETKGVQGKKGTAYLNDNTPIEFQYEVMEADNLVTSHNGDMSVNPEFPSDLQPRERSRKASMLQVENMANKLNPERLGENTSVAHGAPIIGKDSNVVESGNGRTLAIRKAYHGKTGADYRAWLKKNSSDFGIADFKLKDMKQPVLVRRRITQVDDLVKFTQQANEADTAKLSSTEQAVVDAKNLTSDDMGIFNPDKDGNIGAASNKTFVNRFLEKMSPEERSGYLTEDGRANKQLIDRIQSAIFQKAYGSTDLLKLTAEESDPDIKNILNGLNTAAGSFAQARGLDGNLAGIDVVDSLVSGINLLRQARSENPEVGSGNGNSKILNQLNQSLSQGDIFGSQVDPNTQEVAIILATNIRSGKRIGEFIDNIGVSLKAYIADLSQMEMFGTKQTITVSQLIFASKEKLEAKYEEKQQDLFGITPDKGTETKGKPSNFGRGFSESEQSGDTGRTETEKAGTKEKIEDKPKADIQDEFSPENLLAEWDKQAAEIEQKENEKKKPTKKTQGKKTIIGQNEDGKDIYTDDKGHRSINEGGVLVGQSVSIIPGVGGTFASKEKLFNDGKYEFLTKDELDGFNTKDLIRRIEAEQQIPKSLLEKYPDVKKQYDDRVEKYELVYAEDTKTKKVQYRKVGTPTKETKKPTAKDKAQETKKHLAAAAAKLAKINKILGERGSFSTEKTDNNVYAEIKPLLQGALDDILAAGQSAKDFVSLAMSSLSSKGRVYFERFIKEDMVVTKGEDNATTNKDNERRPGTQGVDTEGDQEVSGGRGGALAGDRGNNNSTEPGGFLEGSKTEDVPQAATPGDIETDGIRSGVQDVRDSEQVSSSRDAVERRQDGSVEGMVDERSGGTGRGRVENYHIDDPKLLIGGTPKKRFAKNQQAIETYNELVDENRDPTSAEKDILAGYIGWGSFGQELFQGTWSNPTERSGWEKENQWLREHLGKEAWESAQRSIINAHYTDPPTVTAVWDILKKMGFKGGRVLEPSAGVGNFFGLMPKDLKQSSDLTGIELDNTTAGIAKMLYPNANIQQMGYQDSKTADNFYDVVVGNWPFAKDGPADRRYNKFRLSLHDYFFVKALDQVRPGGFVVGITSSGTMDKKAKVARLQMDKRADLVAAFRMPSGAFKEYAGTSVVADLIIFQKRKEGTTPNHHGAWSESVPMLDKNGKPVKAADGKAIFVNEYWAEHPNNVLGEMTVGHGTTQGREGMIVNRKNGYEKVLSSIAERIPEKIMTPRTDVDHVRYISNNTTERQNSITVAKDGLYVVMGERLANLNDVAKYEVKDEKKTADRKEQIKSLTGIRDAYGKLLDSERLCQDGIEDLRKELKTLYDGFVKKHGSINGSYGLEIFKKVSDPLYPALSALELNVGTKKKPKFKPSKIFTESTQRTKPTMENPTIAEAFVLDRNENALYVDLESIAEKANSTVEKVKAELTKNNAIFETPAGVFEVADVYLAGNVKQKLREAKAAQATGKDLSNNIKELEKVIPEDTPYFQIEVSVGATWVPQEVYQDFIGDLGNLPQDVKDTIRLTPSINGWIVKFDNPRLLNDRQDVQAMWVTEGSSFTKVISAAFTGSTIRIMSRDSDGNKYLDTELSLRANEKVDEIRTRFKDWIWADVDRRVAMEKQFNEIMNAYATPNYDGSFLNFDGMALQIGENEFNLRKHQVNGIWRGIVNGRGLYAHEVGTGKTFTMAGIAVESRRYGLAKKPLLLAHNANSESVAKDINVMYPGAKVLYIDNLTPKTIDSKLYQIANDDWDAIVMPHSIMDRLTLSEETLNRISAEEIAALEADAIESAAEEGFDIEGILDDEEALRKIRGATTAKELVKQRNRIIQTIQKQAQRSSRENAVTFESLGIDMIIVDEAHIFKKPPISTRMRVKGLNTEATSTSIGLHFLTSYVKEINNGKGVFTFTGTPITNTLNEVFNQMRYVMSDKMENAGIDNWDAWFNTFADVESDIEITAAGDYQAVTRLTEFNNVPELRRFSGQYMDIVFADDMPEFKPRPTDSGKTMKDKDISEEERDELLNGRVDDGEPIGRPYKKIQNEVADMSPDQEEILRDVMERAVSFRNATGKERYNIMRSGDRRNPVVVEGDAAKAGFDARLYDRTLPDHPNNKINRSVTNIMEHYLEHEKSAQVVFMEKGFSDTVKRTKTRDGIKTTTTHRTFNAAKELIDKLVEAGIPREQIAIVEGKTTKAKRKEIADAVNKAEIRVVIGQTSTLGTGVNMQENLRAMHHLDAPWMPGELEQRNGRGHRQGNRWNTVIEYRYITNRIDGKRWQVLAKKQRMIQNFLKAKEGVRTVSGDALDMNESNELEDITSSFSEAAGDARILVRAKLEKDVEKLLRRERTHDRGTVDARRKAEKLTRQLPKAEQTAKDTREDSDHYLSQKDKPFSITLEGKAYDKKKDANAAFEKIAIKLSRAPQLDVEEKVGSYLGFEIIAEINAAGQKGVNFVLERKTNVYVKPFINSLNAHLRNLASRSDKFDQEIVDVKSSIEKLKSVSKEKFGQADLLKRKRDQLAQVEADLQAFPDPPPPWLAQGAPIDTDVYIDGKAASVDGHRAGEHDYYLLVTKEDGTTDVISYKEAMDENGIPIYEGVETEQVPTGATPITEEYGTIGRGRVHANSRMAQFSTTSVKPWAKDFPNVYGHTNTATLKNHPDYEKAKAGDAESAARLVSDLIKVDRAKALGEQFPKAMLVSVHAEEESGRNKIPEVLAGAISSITGLPVDGSIVQTNRSQHTTKKAAQRVLSRAVFDGEVIPGQEYILIDDVVTTGGTIAEIRHYIENAGGKVVAISSLSYARGSGKVALHSDTLTTLKERFNQKDLEQLLQEYNVAGKLEAISESEGRYLLKFKSIDAIRNKFSAERQAGNSQVLYSLLQRESADLGNDPQSKPAVTLSQIQKWFKDQSVGLNPDGSIWVRLKNGAGLIIRNVKQVSEGKYLLSTESGKMDQNGIIAGKYLNNEIELVDGVATGLTFSHETEHWLEDIGVITPGDQFAMNAKIRNMDKKGILPFDLKQDQRENRANFLAQYLADREQFRGTTIGKILQKIADFLDGLLNLGRSSVRKVARGIESGEIFSRPTNGVEIPNSLYETRVKPAPKKTIKAYKLFKVKANHPGQLFPLFVGANESVPIGIWQDAEVGPITAQGKVKSKLGPLAFRPGWHAGDIPVATHIGESGDGSSKPQFRPADQVWAEVEVPDDVDWQTEANSRAQMTKAGNPIARTAHITDQIPVDGHYRYKTNSNMTGEWIISGAMKVNRVLSDAEVVKINEKNGIADLPRANGKNFDAKKYGFEAQNSTTLNTDTKAFKDWFGDSVVTKNGEAGGEPLVVYHWAKNKKDEFFPFSHFGTKDAAKERMKNEGETDGEIYEAYLKLENTIESEDTGTHTPIDIAHEIGGLDLALDAFRVYLENVSENDIKGVASRAGFVDESITIDEIIEEAEDTYNRLNQKSSDIVGLIGDPREYINEKAQKKAFEFVFKYAKENEIDGIIYENQIEDPGSISYIAFNPTQIKSIYNRGTWSQTDPRVQYSTVSDFSSKIKNRFSRTKSPGYQSESFKKILPPKVAEQMEINRGVKKTTMLERIKDIAGTIAHERYHFPELMKDQATPSRSVNKEVLRRQQDVGQIAQDRAKREITNFIRGLDREGMDMYALNIILADEVRMIEDGLREDGKLSNGFETTDQVIAAYKKLQAETKKNASVTRALKIRKKYHKEVSQDLVKYGILPKQILQSPDYFHHQILKYFNEKKQNIGAGSQEVRNKWRGWMKGRVANAEEYNTEYLEAEFMVMAQQIGQIETAKNIVEIEKENNVLKDLKGQAKEANLKELELMAPTDEFGKPEDLLKPFKAKIAIGFGKISKLVKDGELTYDQEYEGVVHAIHTATDTESEERSAINHPLLFQFLSNQLSQGHTGAGAAAMIYKGIKTRDRFIKETLGDKFKTYKSMIPEGYREWKPKPGNGWFWTGSIADQVLNDVLTGVRSLEEKDVRKVLARGRDTTWVIPQGLATQMDNLRPNLAANSMLEKTSTRMLSTWKQWILLNPLSAVKYNLNNMSGDLDAVMAYNPKILKGMKQAFIDLRKWNGAEALSEELKKELREVQKLGAIGSGFSVQEVEDVMAGMKTDAFIRDILMEEKPNLAVQYWQKTKELTSLREDILRLAAYRWFKSELEGGRRNLYGASNVEDIKNLVEKGKITEAAAKLSRELLGDYGNISSTGEYIRRQMIPFYSWMEINLPRYVHMFRNLKEEGESTKGLSLMMAKKGTVFAAKASVFMGAIMLWNMSLFPDEEEDLGESGRKQMHLIIGRRKDGTVISIRMQGAFSDALSWFGGEDLPSDIADLVKGRATIQDKLADIPKAVLNKTVNSLRPEPKLLYESITGKSSYPNVLAPRPIRDKVENVLKTFKMDYPYRWVLGRPGRGDNVMEHIMNDLAGILIYSTEPGAQAYYDTRRMVFDWKDNHGLESGGGTPTKKGNTLYYYKQAMKYGDIPAAEKYLKQYYIMGGTYKGLKQSIKMAHPLSGINKNNRYKFRQSLSPAQVNKMKKGLSWYQQTYVNH